MFRRIWGICCQNFCKNKGQLRDVPMKNLRKKRDRPRQKKVLSLIYHTKCIFLLALSVHFSYLKELAELD